MKRVVIDTNLYIDWINAGLREDVLGARVLSRNRADFEAIRKVSDFELEIVG